MNSKYKMQSIYLPAMIVGLVFIERNGTGCLQGKTAARLW